MHIGMITGEYPPMRGGISAYTNLLTQKLEAQGHKVFILSSKDAQQQIPAVPLTRVRHWRIGILNTIPRWAKENQLDVVNLQFQTAAFGMSPWVHFLPQAMRTPFVTTFHDLRFPYLFPKAGPLRDWIVMHLARTSDGVIITNAEDRERVAHLPLITTVSIGSNMPTNLPADYNPARWREKMGFSVDNFLLAYFGFLNHSKGIDTLLHALADLQDSNIKLLMIGGRTGASDVTNVSYAEKVDALVAELGLQDQIAWTGYAQPEEVSAYLKAADVVVLPYRDGASHRRASLITSIELECAIITTKPAVPVPELERLMLIKPEDHPALVEKIRLLKESPEIRQQLREHAATLRGRFDWEGITGQTLAFYERVLEAAQ